MQVVYVVFNVTEGTVEDVYADNDKAVEAALHLANMHGDEVVVRERSLI